MATQDILKQKLYDLQQYLDGEIYKIDTDATLANKEETKQILIRRVQEEMNKLQKEENNITDVEEVDVFTSYGGSTPPPNEPPPQNAPPPDTGEIHPEGGYPHINLMDRGTGAQSMDYVNNPLKEKLSTCRCNNCLNLYRKIHKRDSPLEYRTLKDNLPTNTDQGNSPYNAWTCPPYQAKPSPEDEELIRRAPWKLGRVYYSTDGRTPDIDKDGSYHSPGSIKHYFDQITEIK